MKKEETNNELVNCLRNERITVRFVPNKKHKITDPDHVLYGGMAQTSVRSFCCPTDETGKFQRVLSKEEESYLTYVLGLKEGDLNPYKLDNNFWYDSNISVELSKHDTFFDMSDPMDYIKVKILMANNNVISPSLRDLDLRPKETYQFVIIGSGEESNEQKSVMNNTMKCYKEYGKVEDNADILRILIEILEFRPLAVNSKLEQLQIKCNDLIQKNPARFLNEITNPMLPIKVLIRKSEEAGLITKKGNYYYYAENGSPLCSDNEEPTLEIAAKFLTLPKNQNLKFELEKKTAE